MQEARHDLPQSSRGSRGDDRGVAAIRRAAVIDFVTNRYGSPTNLAMEALGQGTPDSEKQHGYGRPLRVTFTAGGRRHDLVLRTMGPDPFGHDRRADRIAEMHLSYETFGSIPRHVKPVAVGLIARDGALCPHDAGEPFLVTEFVPGSLYAESLDQLRRADAASALDVGRAEALADYLAALHAVPATARQYRRSVRDTVGDGQGLFGILDAYPDGDEVAPRERLIALEQAAVRARWKLRDFTHRASRTHGDFHPFNIIFREGTDFSMLDCSRGAAGDPADDLTSLSINYPFFSLAAHGCITPPFRRLWDAFWQRYQARREDPELYEVVPLFFSWRVSVLACPMWYPRLPGEVRDRLLRFAERLLAGESFSPDRLEDLL